MAVAGRGGRRFAAVLQEARVWALAYLLGLGSARTRAQTAAQKGFPLPAPKDQGNQPQGIQSRKSTPGKRGRLQRPTDPSGLNRPRRSTIKETPSRQHSPAPVQSRGRKRKQSIEIVLEPGLQDPKRQRTSPTRPAEDGSASSSGAAKYQAWPITPPQDAGDGYRCIIDYGREPFSITWQGTPEYPDLGNFPTLDDHVGVSRVPLSPALATIWRGSALLDYGSYASIRVSERHIREHSSFPILKLAHPTTQSLALIEHEFNILAELKSLGLPVPEIDTQPIVDDGRICGYRMKTLTKLELRELRCRQHDIQGVLRQLHSAGFCHGGVTPSNIMKDGRNRIILIDFGFAGRTGSAAPPFIPSWVYAGGIFEAEGDLKAFAKFIS